MATPDGRAIATSCNAELAAATALAVARHHRDHLATITGPDGSRLEVDRFGTVTASSSGSVEPSWQAIVAAAVQRLAADGSAVLQAADVGPHRPAQR